MNRIISFALVFVLTALPALAETPFRRSIREAANAAAQSSTRGRGENPLLVPGLVLVGGGGALTLLAFLNPSGECTEKETASSYSVKCGTSANKGMLFAGLGAAAVGGLVIMRGEKQRSTPTISPRPGGFAVAQRVRF